MKPVDHLTSAWARARQAGTAISTASGVELLDAAPFLGSPVRWLERHPALHGLVLSAFGLRRPLFVDHVGEPRPRFGYGRPELPAVRARLDQGRPTYERHLATFAGLAGPLTRIPLGGDLNGTEPYWRNGWLPPMDAASLYGFLATVKPRRYVEVGSGVSTKFARRAISDHDLGTHLMSIDPAPRAHIDRLCDEVVRDALEDTDLAVFDELRAGDVVFFDGSHRTFMGSDVTVFFLEVLPRLAPGVLVHIHDIWLPRDYPPEWRWRHYSEQYLLAAYLIGERAFFDIELPNAYVSAEPGLDKILDPLWRRLDLPDRFPPTSFWLTIKDDARMDRPTGRGADLEPADVLGRSV